MSFSRAGLDRLGMTNNEDSWTGFRQRLTSGMTDRSRRGYEGVGSDLGEPGCAHVDRGCVKVASRSSERSLAIHPQSSSIRS